MELNKSTRDMLAAIEVEIQSLQDRIRVLVSRKKTLEQWAAEEQPQGTLPGIKPSRTKLVIRPRLSQVLKGAISNGKPWTNRELGEFARGNGVYEADEKIDLRSVNSFMLSLMNGGVVERVHKKWVKK